MIRPRHAFVTSKHVVHATPGYFVISPIVDSGRVTRVFHAPVIAWAIEPETYQPYPITLDGIVEDDPVVLQPDGSVESLGRTSFSSIAEWLIDVQDSINKKKAK